MTKNEMKLPPELMNYLRKRAVRSGLSLQETVESLIRENMHYDDMLAKMDTVMESPVRKFFR